MKKPVNENYSATVAEIKYLVPLANCDNVVHANLFGNLVVVSKETKIGDIGVFFPIETELSESFLSSNNLYRESTLNKDQTAKGYFEKNGRIRAVKFRQNASMGIFLPLSCLDFTEHKENLKVGDSFDEINETVICKKYVSRKSVSSGGGKSSGASKKIEDILLPNQFRFHSDTVQLGKNMHRLTPNSVVHISYKLHGTSFVASNILCKKKLSQWDKIGKLLRFNVMEKEYKNIFSSRRVIKNLTEKSPLNTKTDIYEIVNNRLKDFLDEGMTIYGEIVGFTPDGTYIQRHFDYGCNPGEHMIAIYRITHTTSTGKVIELSAGQVQDWCKKHFLGSKVVPVPELYYGKLKDIEGLQTADLSDEIFSIKVLERLKELYLEKDCYLCKKKVPAEGIVIRTEGKCELEVFKYKSFRFYEFETKELDEGVLDIEESQGE